MAGGRALAIALYLRHSCATRPGRETVVSFESEFQAARFVGPEAEIYYRQGGSGPPLLCLHGYPQTHYCWHRVAPALARRFTVILPDLRGYGASRGPDPDAAHENYSKRAMAGDLLELMDELGHQRFRLAGHDRGGRVAYRMALDAPERVAKLATLDIVTTLDMLEAMDAGLADNAYHWFFLAQPAPLPETLIRAEPDFYLAWTLKSWLVDKDAIAGEAFSAYREAFVRPGVIEAMCADYRAGLTTDPRNDREDREAGRRIRCPMLALWGERGVARDGIDKLELWRRWCDEVTGRAIECGHFLMEEAPEETAAELLAFFAE